MRNHPIPFAGAYLELFAKVDRWWAGHCRPVRARAVVEIRGDSGTGSSRRKRCV